jgi:cobalt-zinc-cadmium efflux system membrane fusion protein
MIRLSKYFLFAIPALLAFTSCGSAGKDENTAEKAEPADTGIVLTLAQVNNGEIAFGSIEKKQLSFDIKAKGKLALTPQHSASVSSMTGGRVESILVKPGDQVKAGQVLATMVSQEIIQMQQDYITAETRCRLLEKEYLRQKELSSEKITSEKKFQEAEASYTEAKGIRESIRLKLQLININTTQLLNGDLHASAPVVSPIAGTVEHVKVNLGRNVEPNTVLFSVINKDRLNIELMVFEKDVPFIRAGQRVTFELANLGGQTYEARVTTIGRMVEEDARTVRVMADFMNASSYILPGMFVAAEIHTDEQELDALPEEAVVTDHDGTYCYYTISPDQDKQFRFNRLPLKTGFREEGFVQVEPLTKFPAGARIVVKGTYFIKAQGLKDQE